MAEIAGAAVGIASLGIQVCQGLIGYYTRYQSFHDDISAVVRRLEGLNADLKILETMKGRMNIPDDKLSEQLENAIDACKVSAKKLEKMQKKCGETNMAGSWEDKMKLVRNRLYWPFKKGTLSDMENTVDRLQQNLHLALQILGIEVENRHFETISSATNSLVTRADMIDTQLQNQTQALQSLQKGVYDMAISQGEQTSAINSHIASQTSHLALQLETVMQRLEPISIHTTQIYELLQAPASVNNDIVHARQDLKTSKRTLRRYSASITRLRAMPQHECNCHYFNQKRQEYKSGWFTSTILRYSSEHLPICPRFPHSDFSYVVEKQIKCLDRLLGTAVRVAFWYSRETGWRKICPTLSMRAVVPNDSPAFKILEDVLYHIDSTYNVSTLDTAIFLDELSTSVARCFRQKLIAPTDNLVDGTNLLHAACYVLLRLEYTKRMDVEAACDFLDFLLAQGVSPSGEDEHGRAPFHLLSWILIENRASYAIFSHFISRLDTWSVGHYRLHDRTYSDALAELLGSEHLNKGFEEAFPFEEAVLKRSESSLSSLLKAYSDTWKDQQPRERERTWEDAFACCIHWPEGVRLLLCHAPNDIRSMCMFAQEDALQEAIECGNIGSVCLLLQAGCVATAKVWDTACYAARKFEETELRELYTMLARELADTEHEPGELFAVSDLSPLSAQCLWEVGFQDIDIVFQFKQFGVFRFSRSINFGTLLWYHSAPWRYRKSSSKIPLKNYTALIDWFVGKGADLNWIHPEFCTSPGHWISRAIWSFSSGMDEDPISHALLKDILFSSRRDHCVCFCSEGGCVALGTHVQGLYRLPRNPTTPGFNGGWYYSQALKNDDLFFQVERLMEEVFSDVNVKKCTSSPLGAALLRVITFDRLQLTHTCCQSVHDEIEKIWPFRREVINARCTEKEMSDIHYCESKDIDLLNKLLAEFEPKWNAYNGTLKAFTKNFWEPRMEEVLAERSRVDEAEVRRIEELGVRLWEPFGPEKPTDHCIASDSA